MIHIRKPAPLPDPALLQAFAGQSTATVHEAMGRRGAVHSSIKPLTTGRGICGPALTVQSQSSDNLMLLKALDVARPGDVIVVDMGENIEAGPWGEITTLQAIVRQVNGLVTNGSVRDARAIWRMGFPVYCRAVSIKGTGKDALGYINHPISFAGTLIHPGDLILGDDDGLVVIPLQEAEEVLQKAREREEKEAAIMERIRAGESFFAFGGFGEALRRKGCVEEE